MPSLSRRMLQQPTSLPLNSCHACIVLYTVVGSLASPASPRPNTLVAPSVEHRSWKESDQRRDCRYLTSGRCHAFPFRFCSRKRTFLRTVGQKESVLAVMVQEVMTLRGGGGTLLGADLVPIGSYFNMLMGIDVRGRENW